MSLTVINPFNQDIICELNYDDHLLVKKLSALQKTFSTWRNTTLDDRIKKIKDGLLYFDKNQEQIAQEISMQMGKPIKQARGELNSFFERADYMISIAKKSLSPDIFPEQNGIYKRIDHEPLGIVFNIAAWNYPLLIPVNVIIPALLAGNVVLLKHSARTPLCGGHFEKAFGELVSHVVLTHKQTKKVITDNRIHYIAFTGSVDGGRKIHEAASFHFIDTGLELGGKDAAFVAKDADLDTAVEQIVDGACYNAGQSCCGIERVYVHHELYDDFLARAKAIMANYTLGNPLDEHTTLGPLASSTALDYFDQQVEEATQHGAKVLLGAKRLADTKGNFYLPTLIADVPNNARLMQEESFGPLLPVASVQSEEDAYKKINDSEFGLTASVWTKDANCAERFASNIDAGTIFQNRCDYLDPALPWTGYKDSGKGSTLSTYGFLYLTRRKAINFKK